MQIQRRIPTPDRLATVKQFKLMHETFALKDGDDAPKICPKKRLIRLNRLARVGESLRDKLRGFLIRASDANSSLYVQVDFHKTQNENKILEITPGPKLLDISYNYVSAQDNANTVVSIAPSKPHDVETSTEANFRNEIKPQAVPDSYTTNVDDSPYVEEPFQDSGSSYAPSEEYCSDNTSDAMEKAPDEEQESSSDFDCPVDLKIIRASDFKSPVDFKKIAVSDLDKPVQVKKFSSHPSREEDVQPSVPKPPPQNHVQNTCPKILLGDEITRRKCSDTLPSGSD
ncbi:hypothetical protein FQA39_LY03299 [Lamprigera yunnana]|nr:hypothetical protein FQA39_LY03299 [Lamprigera yunnana]